MVILLAPSALEMTPGSESRRSGIVQDMTTALLGINYEAIGIHGRGIGRSTGSNCTFRTSMACFLPRCSAIILSRIMGILSITLRDTRVRSDEMTDWEAGPRVALDERGGTERCFFLA